MGWSLVQHAIAMVMSNLDNALKASLVPFGIVLLIGLVFPIPQMPVPASGTASPEQISQFMMQYGGAIALASFVTAIVSIFVFSWVAVTWHRFILLEEYPAAVPAVTGRPIFRYIWKSFLAGLLVALAAIPVMLIALPIIGMFTPLDAASTEFSLPALIIFFIAGSVLSWVWLRIAISLPGTAIGQDMGFRAGWEATSRLSGAVFGAASIIVAFNLGIGALLALLFTPGSLLGVVLGVVVQWFTLMVGASMLTTLYGHLVEGRDLV